MKERTYFAQVLLVDGRYVNLIFTSSCRKGSSGNQEDLLSQSLHIVSIERRPYTRRVNYRGRRYYVLDMSDVIHPLNRKNMEDWCFEEYETIDLRREIP